MRSFEERIRPPVTAKPWPRDILGATLVIALTATLLWAANVSQERHSNDVVGQMFSFYLLPAIGFAFALRCGAIDLSVWAVAGLGGVVAVSVLKAAGGPAAAIGTAFFTGGLIGAIHGFLVGRLRLPSIIVTLVAGIAIVLILRAIYGARLLEVPQGAFESWLNSIPAVTTEDGTPAMVSRPLVLRVLLVFLSYAAAVLVLLAIHATGLDRAKANTPVAVFGSLMASGALAGLAGAMWLVDHGSVPIPSRVIGDLRIPAAALLAGACFFAGRGRTLLVMICLPATLLAATFWRLEIGHFQSRGYYLQMLMLMGMTIVTHLAASQAIARWPRARTLAALSIALTAGGMLAMAAGTRFEAHAVRSSCHLIGLVGWVAGAVLLIVSRAATTSQLRGGADMHR